MISASIDGSVGGSSQLFDLLSLVSDPAAYADKVKKLEEATAENKKFVELIAPASDIISLRETSRADRQLAAEELADATAKAAEIISTAKSDAAVIKDAAHRFAADTKKLAEAALKDVQVQKSELERAEKEAKSAAAESRRATTAFKKASEEAKAQTAAAAAALQDTEALKADILAKHRAFIESL